MYRCCVRHTCRPLCSTCSCPRTAPLLQLRCSSAWTLTMTPTSLLSRWAILYILACLRRWGGRGRESESKKGKEGEEGEGERVEERERGREGKRKRERKREKSFIDNQEGTERCFGGFIPCFCMCVRACFCACVVV